MASRVQPARVLIVEDDANLRDLLCAALRLEGWMVDTAGDATEAERTIAAFAPDLAILDVHLGPGDDGLSLARRIRERYEFPFIFLTDRNTIEDRLAGFDSGADDYVAKPFSLAELVARLRVVLGRRRHETTSVLSVGPLTVDQGARQVYVEGEPVELTRIEFDLLAALAQQVGRVVSKGQLLAHVWGFEGYDENLVQVHLSSLRRKLGPPAAMIRTVRGVGYVLDGRTAR